MASLPTNNATAQSMTAEIQINAICDNPCFKQEKFTCYSILIILSISYLYSKNFDPIPSLYGWLYLRFLGTNDNKKYASCQKCSC